MVSMVQNDDDWLIGLLGKGNASVIRTTRAINIRKQPER